MPRKRRAWKRALYEAIPPSAEHYLATGQIVVLPGDNPFVVISLMTPAACAARALWMAGDEASGRSALAQVPPWGHACRGN